MSKEYQPKIKIFSDGADKAEMLEMYKNKKIMGLTTNPTLMRKAGILDYREFCLEILRIIKDKPISFEVFSDDFKEMERQAREISNWGHNVYVKIPIQNTKGESSYELVRVLTADGIKVNVTAITNFSQVKKISHALNELVPSYISIFAGRIADTGVDPISIVEKSVNLLRDYPKSEVIWASPRELLNVLQAEAVGCQIITITKEIFKKLDLIGYDLNEYSLDTVKMFYSDAVQAGYTL